MKVRMGLAGLALGLMSLAGSAVPATSNLVADDYVVRACVTVTPKSVTVTADDTTVGQTVSQPTTCEQI